MTMPHLDIGRGVCAVFLHGNPDCKESWTDAIDRLATDHRCIAPDLPGFGASARVPTYRELLPDAQANALGDLLDEVGVDEPVLLVVHDLGAVMGASFAMRFPERVRGILAINTTFLASYPGHAWGYAWAIPFLGPAFASMMRFGLADAMKRESPDLDARHADRMVASLHPRACRTIGRMYQFMYNPIVKLLQAFGGTPHDRGIPVRVLWGARDRYISIRYARVGGEPIRIVPECTHFLPLERPDIVAEEVRAFGPTSRARAS
jgi:pimeloyl-ACP methyl ester carboxylesterase